jgi:hypothetical protein
MVGLGVVEHLVDRLQLPVGWNELQRHAAQMIEVVDAPAGVLHIEMVVFVGDHPCRIFGRNDHVKIAEVKPAAAIIALHQGPEFLIAAGHFDQLYLMRGKLIHMTMETPEELFGATDDKRYGRGGNYRYLHDLYPRIIPKPPPLNPLPPGEVKFVNSLAP